jgi:hypothetical protein
MERWVRFLLFAIDIVASPVRLADRKLIQYRHDLLRRSGYITPTEQDLQAITESKEAFLANPREITKNLAPAVEKYRPLLEVYFLMKQATALYEAESKRLPIQVFNDMRNALDHIVRSMLPKGSEQESRQLDKAEGHIQRAFLDTAKLLCAFFDESCNRRHRSFSAEQMAVASNGEYIREFTRLQYLSHAAFADAKLKDYELGGDDEVRVREKYVEAVLAHKRVYDYQKSNYHNLRWAKAKVTLLKGLSWLSAILASLVAGWLLKAYSHVLRLWQ